MNIILAEIQRKRFTVEAANITDNLFCSQNSFDCSSQLNVSSQELTFHGLSLTNQCFSMLPWAKRKLLPLGHLTSTGTCTSIALSGFVALVYLEISQKILLFSEI